MPKMQPKLDRLLRASLRVFSPYRAGTSADEARRRYGFEEPVKLSQNENPLGSSPRALEAVRSITILSDYDDGWRIVQSNTHPAQPLDEALKNAEQSQ